MSMRKKIWRYLRLGSDAPMPESGPTDSEPTPESTLLDFYEQAAARDRRAEEAAHGYRQRIGNFSGRLVVAPTFGIELRAQPELQPARATRIAQAIRSLEMFDPNMPMGVSIHLSHDRTEQSYDIQEETAALLAGSLKEQGFSNMVRSRTDTRPWITHFSHQDFWLRDIAQAPETTARLAEAEPDQIGHLAIASSMDFRELGMAQPFPGDAFLLTGTSEAGVLTWQQIASDLPLR
ncbi:MAG: hypothetical protein ABWX94_02895 [Candidatus Saccharimonadales bacterium]